MNRCNTGDFFFPHGRRQNRGQPRLHLKLKTSPERPTKVRGVARLKQMRWNSEFEPLLAQISHCRWRMYVGSQCGPFHFSCQGSALAKHLESCIGQWITFVSWHFQGKSIRCEWAAGQIKRKKKNLRLYGVLVEDPQIRSEVAALGGQVLFAGSLWTVCRLHPHLVSPFFNVNCVFAVASCCRLLRIKCGREAKAEGLFSFSP